MNRFFYIFIRGFSIIFKFAILAYNVLNVWVICTSL